MSALLNINATSVTLARAAAADGEAVRLGEVNAALALKSGLDHTHTAGDVSGLASAAVTAVGAACATTPTVAPTIVDGVLSFGVVLKPSGGLVETEDGVAVDIGTASTQAAAGDHAHEELHDALTVAAGASVTLTLDGQELSAEATVAEGGGLVLSDSGLAADVGTLAGQVAAGDHTHAGLHDPVQVIDTSSVTLSLIGQQLAAAVRLDADPDDGIPISVSPSGLYVSSGPGGAAAYAHEHGAATTAEAGFMSATDKVAMETVARVVAFSWPVQFQRERALVVDERLDGQVRFPDAVRVTRVDVTALAPDSETVLVLEVDGDDSDLEVSIAAGPSGVEVVTMTDADEAVAADAVCRWKVASGPESSGAATCVALTMNVTLDSE